MVDDELDVVGPGDALVTVADIPLPGVYELTESTAGVKTQYLTETSVAGAEDNPYGADYPTPDDSGAGETESGDADAGDDEGTDGDTADEPPRRVFTIRAHVGGDTWNELVSLREDVELFSLRSPDVRVDDLECDDLKRSVSGENPFSYDVTLVIQEYREVDTEDVYPYNSMSTNPSSTDVPGSTPSDFTPGEGSTPVDYYPEGQAPPVQNMNGISIRLGDGDVLERKLINGGGRTKIHARGNGWRISNIGVSGFNQNGGRQWLTLAGNGIIENVYLGDGGNAGGMFVMDYHSGTIIIRNCYIADSEDNAIYASAPGNGAAKPRGTGGQGQVLIENTYAENSRSACFRLGTNGSYLKNCVAVDNRSDGRAYWNYTKPTKVIDSDLTGRVTIGGKTWGFQKDAHITWENSRHSGPIQNRGSGQSGSPSGNPSTQPPEGVPTSAQEAANGTMRSRPPGG